MKRIVFLIALARITTTLWAQNHVVIWGDTTKGRGNIPIFTSSPIKISCGFEHVVTLNSDSTLSGWGYNGLNQIPDTTFKSKAIQIDAGTYFTLALDKDSMVHGFGSGGNIVPPSLGKVKSVHANNSGEYVGFAVSLNDTLVGWGYNRFYNQLDFPDSLGKVIKVEAGRNVIALNTDSSLTAWGENNWGQNNIPALTKSAKDISVGDRFSIVLFSDGTLSAWGSQAPSIPRGLNGVVKVECGTNHCLALLSDSSVVAFGQNGSGQINVPPTLGKVIDIGAGDDFSVVIELASITNTANLKSDKSSSVFPNPTSSSFTISIPDWNGEKEYMLMDFQGKQLQGGTFGSQQTQISVEDLPKGMYFLRLQNGDKNSIHKVMVE